MSQTPQSSINGDDQAAARPVRGYPKEHGAIQAGDTIEWCGHLLKVEAGAIALGMPVRELTLNVREVACTCRTWRQIGSFRPRPFYVEPHCGNCGASASEHL